jgi:hypothetical protein
VQPVGSSRIGRYGASHRCVAWLIAICMCVLLSASPALARTHFRARIGAAMGIVPPFGHADLAAGPSVPVVYHGGDVMRGVTIHTIFWAPNGFRFSGSPVNGVPGYEPMVQRFLADAAHDSAATSNEFSVLTQYPDRSGAGRYSLSFNPATDSIDDTDPYPPQSRQCPSPAGIATCVTDLELQREIDKVVQSHDPSGRGLHDLWLIFLPPDVDTCAAIGACGTNTFAGYHSISNLGRGPTIYAVIVDPLIEFAPIQGQDPQGNPEAELALATVAHETVEAITNPKGTGWMDPNGSEVGDKCETQQVGTPLGFAPNGAPYNQLINAHQYLIQTMWSNAARGCVPTSTRPGTLPPQSVNLTQFSASISGNTGLRKAGIQVAAALGRGGELVGLALGRTRADGGWGPLTLRSITGAPVGVGDDRDQIAIEFNSKQLKPDLIETGSGGNPFNESGWTGWYDLDHGYKVGTRSVLLAPCFQTGVLSLKVGSTVTVPPIDRCDANSDVATIRTGRLTSGTGLRISSRDNRAVTPPNRDGALVNLTVPVGEPGSASSVGNSQIAFAPSGFPACAADLRAQAARCSGLVARTRYRLTRARGRDAVTASANRSGVARFAGFSGIRGGDVLALTNSARRVLTVLHVSHLRVDVSAHETIASGGTCEPGEYYGPPLAKVPISSAVGAGVAGEGTVCGPTGRLRGLPTSDIAQTDDRSGGQTRTEVPSIVRTTPTDGATLYGAFIAIARAGLTSGSGAVRGDGSPVAVTITQGGRTVFRARNVDTQAGVVVGALSPGAYGAKWVLRDANGDTRTVRTAFAEAP